MKTRNPIAKLLHTPMFRKRVVSDDKKYSRNKYKNEFYYLDEDHNPVEFEVEKDDENQRLSNTIYIISSNGICSMGIVLNTR